MKPIKAKYTEAILFLARILPWIFPKWLQFVAKGYSKKELDLIHKIYEKEDLIESTSLLEGNFKWKAVSVVVKIEHSELDLIRRWLKHNPSSRNYDLERNNTAFKNRYNSGGAHRSLGWIYFHKKNRPFPLFSMEEKTKFCDSCYVTLSNYLYGINYLSLYFFLKDSATEMVCDVDVREVKRYYTFASINPFSPHFKIIQHHDKVNLVEDLINQNIDTVCNDVVRMSNKILRLWRLKKSELELSLIADFYRDTNDPYFAETQELKDKKNNHVHVFPRKFSFLDEKLSSDTSENFIATHTVEKNRLDAFFIKSKAMKSFGQLDNFTKNGLTFYDSHIFISMFINIGKQHAKISEYADFALLKNSNKVEKNYDILFESQKKLELLKENILAIQQEIPRSCKSPYTDSAVKIAKYKLECVDNLKESINRRLSGLNSEIQIQNLRFNRIYSLLVGFLILIQILLAALTIDWEKLGNTLSSNTYNGKGIDSQQRADDKTEHNSEFQWVNL